MEYRADKETYSGILWIYLQGQPDVGGTIEALEEVWSLQAETGHRKVVWDAREVRVPDFSLAQLRQLADFQRLARPDIPKARAAFLVKGDLAFGLARMFMGFFDKKGADLAVFRDLEETVAWLREED